MGLINQLIRSLKNMIKNVFGFLFRKKRKRKGSGEEPIIVPRSWSKQSESKPGKAPRKSIIVKHKRKIPGLRQLNRILAGFLLIINFVFSQFLLGSVGAAAQPVFLLFLGNCYIIVKYLWGSRKKEE